MENRKKVENTEDRKFYKPFKENNDLIFGTRAIIEAIKAGKEIDKLLIQKGLNNDLSNELMALLAQKGINYIRVAQEKLEMITRKNHQGAIAYLSAVNYASIANIVQDCFEKGVDPFIILMDRITDVRNFGAVARTADCAGIHAIVIPAKGSAQIGSDAMKTSAGALNFIPICKENNLKDTIRFLQDSGIKVVACTEKIEKEIYQADLTGPLAIILGSEEDGISPEYLKLADDRAKIPMMGNIESLNISVAAGVITFEAVRQRRIKQ